MTHKQEVKLNRLQMKLEIELQIIQTLLNECGDWHDGTGKDKLVLRVFEGERLEASIFKSNKYRTYIATVPGWKMKMEIRDAEVVELIDEGVEKALKKAEKKVKKVKKAEKKEAKPKKNDYTNTTYLDVYKRVVDIMNKKTGYDPDRDIKDEENEEIDICIDPDGDEHKYWSSAKAFVGGDPEESSIFDEVADLDAIYFKLASRWDAQFCSSCRILGQVDVKDTSPAGIMKALDEAGL